MLRGGENKIKRGIRAEFGACVKSVSQPHITHPSQAQVNPVYVAQGTVAVIFRRDTTPCASGFRLAHQSGWRKSIIQVQNENGLGKFRKWFDRLGGSACAVQPSHRSSVLRQPMWVYLKSSL